MQRKTIFNGQTSTIKLWTIWVNDHSTLVNLNPERFLDDWTASERTFSTTLLMYRLQNVCIARTRSVVVDFVCSWLKSLQQHPSNATCRPINLHDCATHSWQAAVHCFTHPLCTYSQPELSETAQWHLWRPVSMTNTGVHGHGVESSPSTSPWTPKDLH